MDGYKDLFLAEAQEYLQNMTDCLLRLEKEPADSGSLTEIFRATHSLKGMAGTMGYELITELTHEQENILDHLRNGGVALDTGLVNLLFQVVDLLQLLINNLGNQDDFEQETGALRQKIKEWQQLFGKEKEKMKVDLFPSGQEDIFSTETFNEFEKEILKDAVSKGKKCYHIHVWLLEGVLLKSVRAYMVYKAAEKVGEIIKTVPSLQALEEEQFELEFSLLLCGNFDVKEFQKTMIGIAEIKKVEIKQIEITGEDNNGPTSGQFLPPGAENEAVFPQRADAVSSREEQAAAAIKKDKGEAPGDKQKQGADPKATRAEKTVRVETAKLDNLVNLVGELIISSTRVVETGKKIEDEPLEGSLEQLERVTTELQGAVMTLRMVPIKQVFDRFPRMIRDLSIEKGKKLELIISGEETELDRTIVNQIGDPLVHLLRNAVDHGIEREEERKKKGKNPAGKIFLEAHHEGSHVVISVEDDGAGINTDFIKNKILQENIVTREELDNLTRDEIMRFIFHSGFSTSHEITDVSGRGVGMDVVKTTIEALNGNVEVKSKPGKGTKFIFRLPLTLAIIRSLMVREEGEIYAIPIESIKENLYVENHEIKTIQQERVITVREDILPLFCLKEKLLRGKFQDQELYSVVIVQAGDKRAGLVVDELMGQQEIVIKSLSNFINDIKGIAGATVLGDGKVSLILDVASLLEMGED